MGQIREDVVGRPRSMLDRRAGFAAVAYAFGVTMLGMTLPTPLYVLYRQRFGFSELMITVIFATYAVGVIAALVLFGRLSDEIGRRRTLLPGLALSALSAVAFLGTQGVGLLLAGRALSGLSVRRLRRARRPRSHCWFSAASWPGSGRG